LVLPGLLRADDDSPGDEAIKEAITILEARKAQAENKADQEKIGKAIAALEKLLPKAGARKGDAEPPAEPLKLAPATLAKKFKGKAVYNGRTGELTLVYDFKTKDQLADFDLGGSMPTVKAGVLRLAPAETMKHGVNFKSLKVTGQFVVENMGETPDFTPYLKTSVQISFGWSGVHATLSDGKKTLGSKGLRREQVEAKPLSLVFTVTNKRASATVGTTELAGPIEGGAPGQVEFLGGRGGLQVRSLVISGTLEEEWAKEFFAK
jgi:hypothetical protein